MESASTSLAPEPHELDEDHTSKSKAGPFVVSAVLLGMGMVFLVQTLQIPGEGFDPQGPRFLPLCMVVAWLVLSVLYLVSHLRKIARTGHGEAAEKFAHMVPATLLAAALVIYAVVLDPVGYLIATPVFFIAASRALGSRNLARDITIGVLLSTVVYFTFTQALGVRLPEGIIGF